jgi:uncharacterized damage-inducible protein DinB
MPDNRDILVITPNVELHPEIGRFLWMMDEVRFITKEVVAGISQAAIDWSASPATNTIGTLLYHIALVEIDWLYYDMLDQELPDDMVALFPYDSRDETRHLTVVNAVPLSEHLARLDTVRTRFHEIFGSQSLEDFRRPRHLEEYDATPEWIAYHLIEHEAGHRGEMATIRTLAELALGERA